MTTSEVGPTGEPTEGFVLALIDDDPVALYEDAPCGYLSTGDGGRIVKVNQTLCTWTGYRADEFLGRTFQSFLAVGDQIFYETHFAPSLALQGTVREIAVDLVCATGERLPVLVNAVRAECPDGAERTRLAVFDARERRAYERELVAERERSRRAAEEARTLASTLQRALLPAALPRIDGLELGAVYRPAGDGGVGGDFYDVFPIAGGTWGISLGDVCGKGPGAAIVTALVRHAIRALALDAPAPSAVLRGVHEAMKRSPDARGFCTAVFATAEVVDDSVRLRLSVGGHHLPLHVGTEGSVVDRGRHGHLLGKIEPLDLFDDEVTLRPGESLVFYTDGVIEARHDGVVYGQPRLRALLAGHRDAGAQELADLVADGALAHRGGVPALDDIAVLVLRASERGQGR